MKPISLVMLAYNEADIIEKTIRDYYKEIIQKIPGSEFIVAEDGSTDGTKEILKKLEKELSLRVISGNERKGYTKAMLDGLKLAKNDIIFFSDSDGQHDPRDFWMLYPYIDQYDILSGQKSHRKDGTLRVLVSYGMNILLSALFGTSLKDANSGFKLIKKKVVDKVQNDNFSMRLVSAELMARAISYGFKVKEIKVKHFERKYGESRGIPTKKIPGFVTETIFSLMKLRLEFIKNKQVR